MGANGDRVLHPEKKRSRRHLRGGRRLNSCRIWGYSFLPSFFGARGPNFVTFTTSYSVSLFLWREPATQSPTLMSVNFACPPSPFITGAEALRTCLTSTPSLR